MLETEFVLKPLASFRTNIGEFFKQFAKSLNDCRYHREHMRFVCRLQRLYLFGILIFDWKGVITKYTQENKYELVQWATWIFTGMRLQLFTISSLLHTIALYISNYGLNSKRRATGFSLPMLEQFMYEEFAFGSSCPDARPNLTEAPTFTNVVECA